jgi:hypothetical protein
LRRPSGKVLDLAEKACFAGCINAMAVKEGTILKGRI